jgi:arginine/lysine/ornithine decarboxylase
VEAVGTAGSLFKLTHPGYQVADKLKESQPKPKKLDDNDILSILESWLAKKDRHRLDAVTFVFDEVDRELQLPSGSAARHLEKAGAKWGYVVARKGGNTLSFGKGSSFFPSGVNPKLS